MNTNKELNKIVIRKIQLKPKTTTKKDYRLIFLSGLIYQPQAIKLEIIAREEVE